jgi:hypothetical protein
VIVSSMDVQSPTLVNDVFEPKGMHDGLLKMVRDGQATGIL